MICKFCGNVIEDTSDFCFICGQKVADEAPAFETENIPAEEPKAEEIVAEAPVTAAATATIGAVPAEFPAFDTLPQGTPIYATRAGKVTRTSYQAGGAGNYVSINHLDGFSSIYMHMTHYVVSEGQSVSQGQLIGYVGSTGISTGPHLHFGISYAGTYVNPLAYVY